MIEKDKAVDNRTARGVMRGEYIKGADESSIRQPVSGIGWYVAEKDKDREGTTNFIHSARYFCPPVLQNGTREYLTHLWVCRSLETKGEMLDMATEKTAANNWSSLALEKI